MDCVWNRHFDEIARDTQRLKALAHLAPVACCFRG